MVTVAAAPAGMSAGCQVATAGELGRILDLTAYFLRQGGGLPVRLADIQGPLDSAALIMGHTAFLSAMYTHPAAVHRLLTLVTESIPEIAARDRLDVRELGQGFWEVVAHYGFMETPNVPGMLARCAERGLRIDANRASYFLGRETILPTGRARLVKWRKILFIFLARNARPANAFFRIPPNRVIELGAQIEL